jgi:MoxR-like ATPase
VAALGHRIVLKPAQWVRGVTGDAIVQEVLGQVPTPAPEDLAVSR